MEIQDLSKAQEMAKRDNWNDNLPVHLKSAQDEFPAEEKSSGEEEDEGKVLNPGKVGDDWNKLCQEHSETEEILKNRRQERDPYIESRSLDDETQNESETEESYMTAGAVHFAGESGELKGRVKEILSRRRTDFKDLSDRKIEVDISFLQNVTFEDRVMRIIESTIQKYTSVPGHVEVRRVSESGVFQFNVTNNYLSPSAGTSTSSGSEGKPRSVRGRSTGRKEILIYQELNEGISLVPKFAGLPKRIIRYGSHGLTKEGISQLRYDSPSKSMNDIIQQALILSGELKKVLNLYCPP
ncbi:unnamed protein product [Danaus chrysippus]|uniref:(African queen) hypothetical protein n=1 Tax=Danaus chrysippus TaxID=151541 RepID=A0A8J2QPP5_9NEOP|nr:unnamed protein product [Danaus chrysippus]